MEKNTIRDKKTGTETMVDYNIISNKPFQQHHFNPPEKRPPQKEEEEAVKKTNKLGMRDFNIITNRYVDLHDHK